MVTHKFFALHMLAQPILIRQWVENSWETIITDIPENCFSAFRYKKQQVGLLLYTLMEQTWYRRAYGLQKSFCSKKKRKCFVV